MQQNLASSKSSDTLGFILMMLPFIGTSYYFHSINLAPFSTVGYLVSLVVFFRFRADKEKFFYMQHIFVFLSTVFLPVSLYWFFVEGLSFRINTFLGICLGVVFFCASSCLVRRLKTDQLMFCLYLLLSIVLFFFYVQFFASFLFDVNVDFIVSLTGEEQRLTGHSRDIDGIGVFKRTSGIFAEPALHSYVVIILLMSILMVSGISAPILLVAIISVWLSLSASGILLSLIPLIYYFSKGRLFFRVLLLSGVVMFVYLYGDIVFSVFEEQISRIFNMFDDESGSDRVGFVNFFYENPMVFLGGFGVFVDITTIVPPSSFFVSLIYCFGFPVSLFLICYFLISVIHSSSLSRFLIFFTLGILFGYPVSSPFFWFSISLLYISMVHRYNKG